MQSYVSIDLETTGLSPKTDRIIEIGAVKVIEGRRVEKFSTLVNPHRSLRPVITELTGIRDEDLTGAPDIEEAILQTLSFLEELPLLGHSILFDFSFLKKAAADQRLSFAGRGVDTLKISRKYLADLEHRSLDYLCGYYKIPHQAHRALADAEATSALYECLLRQFYSEEEKLFLPEELIFQVKRDAPATKFQKERLYRLAKQHKLLGNTDMGSISVDGVEIEIDGMTKSEASRLTDRILSGRM